MSDYHKDGKLGFERNITILTMQVERLERELKDARERNKVKDKYWHNIGVERNTREGNSTRKGRLQERETIQEREEYKSGNNTREGRIQEREII